MKRIMGKPIKVLIVNDSEADAEMMLQEFRRGGYGPTHQRVAAAAPFLKALDSGSWDVIIAYGNTQNFSAMAVLMAVPKNGMDIPVIVVSSSICQETAVATMRAGATDYVMKENLRDLTPAVERGLRATKLRREQKQSEESRAQLAAIVESCYDAIYSKTLHGIITSWNLAAKRIYGYSEEEVIGKSVLTISHPLHHGDVSSIHHKVIAGHAIVHYETQQIHKNGMILEVSLTLSPIRDHSGKIIGTSTIARDIGERIQIQKQLAQHVEDLARSNQELEQFAYVASHDLQEPLRMVVGFCQLLQQNYQGKLDKNADEFIGFAVEGALRMQRLVNDLLEFSRAGQKDVTRHPIDCGAMLRIVLANLQSAIQGANAKITYDSLPVVSAASSELIQLFQNLIANALKYRGKAAPVIHIGVEMKETEWFFSVRDNGIGIDPKYHDQIFVIFHRLHDRHQFQGAGIGLAICKKIVERNGGRIGVESELDKGATFWFTLPR